MRFLLLCMLAAGCLPGVPRAQQEVPLASFGYVADRSMSSFGFPVRWGSNQVWEGRLHVNEVLGFTVQGYPVINGRISYGMDAVENVSEAAYSTLFHAGWSLPHTPLEFDFSSDIAAIRAACLPQHHWAATLDSLPLTTLLRFDGPVYHAAQFSQEQVSGTDTTYLVPWTTQALPGPQEPQVIWVEGVCRLKGVVQGQVTVLGSDSLFIMGDLITADAILEPCPGDIPPEDTLFGTVPAGSPNRIGVLGERDVFIAATLENGLANGAQTPALTCGWANPDPVITTCGQGRRDVVITAALLATGCSFGTEWWKTTAWSADPPGPQCQCFCPVAADSAFTQVTLWDNTPGGPLPDCLGAPSTEDRRGTLWLYGSLATRRVGLNNINPPSWFGDVWIGYSTRIQRHDPNLDLQAPPFWPLARWDVAHVEVASSPNHPAWGEVDDDEAFAQAWQAGSPGMDLWLPEWDPYEDEVRQTVRVSEWADGVELAARMLQLGGMDSLAHWEASVNPLQLASHPQRVWWEVAIGDVWSDSTFEVYSTWNPGGAEFAWEWNSAVEPAATPVSFALGQPWPNPFNPSCQVELTLPAAGHLTLEVFDLLGRREAVIFDGPRAAGTHSFTLDGADWPAGLHLLRATHGDGTQTRKLLLLK